MEYTKKYFFLSSIFRVFFQISFIRTQHTNSRLNIQIELTRHLRSRMPLHSRCEVRVMQLHDVLQLRTSASLHSVSVGAKSLSTGQCAPAGGYII